MSSDYLKCYSYYDVSQVFDDLQFRIDKECEELKESGIDTSIEAVRIGGYRRAIDDLWNGINNSYKFRVLRSDIKDWEDNY